jgi:hypothetical protein
MVLDITDAPLDTTSSSQMPAFCNIVQAKSDLINIDQGKILG